MQITTATRTVEIYANNEALVTYRNVKDGAAYGPVRTAKADAKAGSVGREVFDAARAAVEVTEVEVTEVEVTEVAAPAGRQYSVTVEYTDEETGETQTVTDWYGAARTARMVVESTRGRPRARVVATSGGV